MLVVGEEEGEVFPSEKANRNNKLLISLCLLMLNNIKTKCPAGNVVNLTTSPVNIYA